VLGVGALLRREQGVRRLPFMSVRGEEDKVNGCKG